MSRVRRFASLSIVIIGAVASVAVYAGSTAWAQQSELQQEIEEPACSQLGDCDMRPPTIDQISKNRGQPIITGRFDAAFAQRLHVVVNGQIYVLGVDGELTVQGGRWYLSLNDLSPPLTVGAYVVIVTTEGFDGQVLTDSLTFTIAASDLHPSTPSTPNEKDDHTTIPSAPQYRSRACRSCQCVAACLWRCWLPWCGILAGTPP